MTHFPATLVGLRAEFVCETVPLGISQRIHLLVVIYGLKLELNSVNLLQFSLFPGLLWEVVEKGCSISGFYCRTDAAPVEANPREMKRDSLEHLWLSRAEFYSWATIFLWTLWFYKFD